MNREIKFRVWDKTRNELFTYINECGVKQLNFNQEMAIESVELFEYLPSEIFVFKTLDIDDVELMQFTGIKDKNDVEIYEGDIVNFDKVEWGGDNNIHVVTWDKTYGCWCFGGGSISDMEFREVIGNIYENPELLEK